MIEMLGVLAIVGVLSVGGIAGYSKAMMKFKINKTIDQVSHLATDIRTLYAQQTTYYGLNTATAIQMGVIPDSLTTSNSEVTNIFGGWVPIWSSDLIDVNKTSKENKAFHFVFNDLPKEACITLATMDWGSPYSSGLLGIMISNGGQSGGDGYLHSLAYDSDYSDGRHGAKHLPLNVAKAASECDCTSASCSIGWKFQ